MVDRDLHHLVARARSGHAESAGALLELYRNYLHLLARTQIDLHLERRASASDVVQQTFLEAYRDFRQFRGATEGELLAWLRRILLNNLSELIEREVLTAKRDLRREVVLDDLESSAAGVETALRSQWTSPTSRARRRETAAIVADRLAQLPDAQREVIVLRNIEGLSFEEVAQRMDRSSGAVRMLWLRALHRLRELLREEDLL